jgi:hypothetical protein
MSVRGGATTDQAGASPGQVIVALGVLAVVVLVIVVAVGRVGL